MDTSGGRMALTDLLQCIGEGIHRGKAVLWSLCQGCKYHVFDVRRECGDKSAEGDWGGNAVLDSDFAERAMKRTPPTEPLVGDSTQRVLIAGCPWMTDDLFGGHIRDCPDHVFCALVA